MYCNEKMKLNKFVRVSLPKNSEYFRRFNGNLPIPSNGSFTGDDVAPASLTKNQQLHAASQINDQLNRQEDDEAQKGKEGAE